MTPPCASGRDERLAVARDRLRRWLTDAALPVWGSTGVDLRRGGFVERLDLDGRPVDAPRRTRVVARQIYVHATAARFGWSSDADARVEHGLRFLHDWLLLADGRFAASVDADGSSVDATFDLYEQAFALFAWASARRGRPDRAGLGARALALLAVLKDGWGHPEIGFEETAPPTAPLRSNPHMHLLEAALAWEEVSTGAGREPWSALADELAGLATGRLIDRETGALRELYDRDWRPQRGVGGRIVEPGHQFEWAWLLMRWATLRRDPPAFAAARRLLEIGEGHGVGPDRGVAFNAIDAEGWVPTDRAAKLWPQTERVKAWALAGRLAEGRSEEARHADARLLDAIAGLERYLLPDRPGLWHESMNTDGSFAPQDCRASSLYHIVGAIEALEDAPR